MTNFITKALAKGVTTLNNFSDTEKRVSDLVKTRSEEYVVNHFDKQVSSVGIKLIAGTELDTAVSNLRKSYKQHAANLVEATVRAELAVREQEADDGKALEQRLKALKEDHNTVVDNTFINKLTGFLNSVKPGNQD